MLSNVISWMTNLINRKFAIDSRSLTEAKITQTRYRFLGRK